MNEKIPKWSSLAKVQKLKIVKSMYIWLFIVPVLARVFSDLEDKIIITVFNHTFNLHLELPFSWKAFYFSALFFASANLVFFSRCYSLIKDHSNFEDFRAQGKNDSKFYEYVMEAGLSTNEFFGGVKSGNTIIREEDKEGKYLKEPFWRLYNELDRARPFWRFLCSILYLIGFILIGIILYQNFISVLRHIV